MTKVLSWQAYFCHDKRQVFATKSILVAAPPNDSKREKEENYIWEKGGRGEGEYGGGMVYVCANMCVCGGGEGGGRLFWFFLLKCIIKILVYSWMVKHGDSKHKWQYMPVDIPQKTPKHWQPTSDCRDCRKKDKTTLDCTDCSMEDCTLGRHTSSWV